MKRFLLLTALLAAPVAFAAPLSDDPGALAAAGNKAYRSGDTGTAVLAWERSLALDSRQSASKAGLAVAAHDGAQSPRITAVETYATFLPADVWVLLLAAGAWTALLTLAAPYVSSVNRRPWHHSLAGISATLALLAIPGIAGADSYRHRGVILKPDTHLQLTPTAGGESLATLAAGDRVRLGEVVRSYRKVTAPDGTGGWIRTDALAPVIPGA